MRVYNIPTWTFFLLIVGGFVLFGVVGLYIALAALPRIIGDGQRREWATAGDFLAAASMLYGLIAALISVAVWQTFNEVESRVSQEAASLGALYRMASHLPEPTRDALTASIKARTRYIMTTEWEEQRHGVPVGRDRSLDNVDNEIYEFKPADSRESNLQAALEAESVTMYSLARQRLHDAHAGVSPALYTVIIVGALITIVLTWLLPEGRFRQHALMTAAAAAMVGMVVFTIVVLDHPFRGGVSISSHPFEDVYDNLMGGTPREMGGHPGGH